MTDDRRTLGGLVESGATMNQSLVAIRPVRVGDLLTLTRMAYANMSGVDEAFTRLANSRLLRALGYIYLPFYMLTAGKGYKAVVRNRIAGCAFFHMRRRSGLIFNVQVNESDRRQGIGRRLMARVEEQIEAGQRPWAALQVDKDNLPARTLYERSGYRAYHPAYLHHHTSAIGALQTPPGAGVEPLSTSSLFRHYAAQERRQGDAWAAAVIDDDYPPPLPFAAHYWRCQWQNQTIGCARVETEADGTLIITLCLDATYWGNALATTGLIRLLISNARRQPQKLDVHFGSSEHLAAAAPALHELGFESKLKPRLLMLKALT